MYGFKIYSHTLLPPTANYTLFTRGRTVMVANTIHAAVVGIAGLVGTAIPTTASPGAVLAVSARARVRRLARRRAAA